MWGWQLVIMQNVIAKYQIEDRFALALQMGPQEGAERAQWWNCDELFQLREKIG